MKRWLILILKLTIAGGLVTYLLTSGKIDFSNLGKLDKGWPWLLAALGVYGVVMLFAALRWKLLLGAQEIHYGFKSSLRLTLIGLFFNQFMPGSTGGDLVKAYYVASDHPQQKAVAVLTVLLDRVFGLAVLVFVAAIAALLNLEFVMGDTLLKALSITTWVVASGILLAGSLFYSDKIRSNRRVRALFARLPFQSALRVLNDTPYLYKSHPRLVIVSILASIGIHLGVIAIHAFLFLALAAEIDSYASLLILVPLSQIAMAIPLTPGSLGTAEAAYHALFLIVGATQGSLVCLLWRLTTGIWGLIGSLIYIASKREFTAKGDPQVVRDAEVAATRGN